jgi:hypothetical protein
MGMTIHYRGCLKNIDLIGQLVDEVEDIAKSLGWTTQRLDGDLMRENTARLVHTPKGATITGYLPIRGVCLAPGRGCEGIDLFFDRWGWLASPLTMALADPLQSEYPYLWVKTQFAGPDVHIAIVKLLKYLENKYFECFEVMDEGDYWQTGNAVLLKKKMEFLDGKIEEVGKALSAAAARPSARRLLPSTRR